jgi:uncharacterized protein YkwD
MEKKRMKLLLTAAVAVWTLNACGGGDSGGSVTNETGTPSVSGVLTDSPVEGVTYRCGNVEQTTDKEGRFFCETTPVSFSVGKVRLGAIGELPDDGFVTPQDLAGVARDNYGESVVRIAVFLQSLDDDGEIETTITLDDALIEKLKAQEIDLQNLTDTELIGLLMQIGVADVITKEAALEHLQRHTSLLQSVPFSGTEIPAEEDTDNNNGGSGQAEESTDTASEETQTTDDNEETLEDALKQSYLDVINEARAQGRECGEYGYFPAVDPVRWNEELYRAAYEHSKDMALSDTFSHTGSGTASDETAQAEHPGQGSSVGERIEYNGYTNWHRYGENIAAGTVMDEAVEAMEGWLESPGHCKNIMKAEFEEVGLAVYYREGSHYTYYWTQDFGTR